MEFHTALVQKEDRIKQCETLDASYDQKLAELRTMYEKKKVKFEEDLVQATALIDKSSSEVTLKDPRVILGSRAVRIVGDWNLAGRDGTHCCTQASLNLARTDGASLGNYSYCTVTQGAIHGLFKVLPIGTTPPDNDIPLFRIEGTPEIIHRIRTGSKLPNNVIEAAAYFVHHLPKLFALGWKWETALMDNRDLFSGDPKIAEELANQKVI
jgi:hypothetical protein